MAIPVKTLLGRATISWTVTTTTPTAGANPGIIRALSAHFLWLRYLRHALRVPIAEIAKSRSFCKMLTKNEFTNFYMMLNHKSCS